jgi:putative ABC transport system permease protein
MPYWLWIRFIARRWITNPLRVGLLVISVALATTLWTAVTRVAFSSVESFEESIGLSRDTFDIRVSTRGERMSAQTLGRSLMTLPSIADLVFVTRESGVITAVSKEGQKGASSPITVVGVRGVGSRFVAPSEEDSVALSETTLRSLGLVAGQSAELELGGTRRALKVARLSNANQASFSRAAVVSLEHLSDLEMIDEVLLAVREEVSLPEAIRDLEVWMKSSLRDDRVIVEPVSAPIERAQAVTAAYRFNIFIVAAMSLCVCALLVYQATQLSLLALSREVSILNVLGLSGLELSSALVLEATLISTCGAILGLVIGYPLTLLVTNSLLETAYDLYGVEFSLLSKSEYLLRSLVTIVTVAAVGSVSAAAASIRATTGSASQGVRRERIHVRPISRRVALVSAVTTSMLLAVSLLWLGISPNVLLTYASVGVSLVWVAGTALAALAFAPFLLGRSASGVSRMLAAAVLKRSGGSYAFGVMAAAVAITLMTSLACMVGSFRGTLQDWSRIRLQGDIFISSAISGEGNESRIPQRLVDSIRNDPEMLRVVPYREIRDSLNGKDVIVAGTDVRAQCQRGVYIFVTGSCEETLRDTSPSVLMSESAARKCALSKGDTITLQERRLKVAGVLREFGTEQPLFVTDESLFHDLYNLSGVKTLTIDLRDSSRVEVVRQLLEQRYREPLVVRNHRELLDLVDGIFNRTFTVTDSVRWIVFILALAGLVSGYLQHAWERRVDLRVLDVQGVNRWEWTRMFCTEALSIVMVSVVIGAVGGVILGYILTEYLNPLVFGWQLRFNIGAWVLIELLGFIVLSVASMLVGAMVVLRRVRRNVGLRDE